MMVLRKISLWSLRCVGLDGEQFKVNYGLYTTRLTIGQDRAVGSGGVVL